MANKKTVRKNKSKRKSRRRGGGDNRSLKTPTISVFKARLQAAQQEEALREEAARREEEQRRREAEAKRLLEEAKSLDSVSEKMNKEKDARETNLQSVLDLWQ